MDFCFFFIFICVCSFAKSETTKVENSCIGKTDGSYWLQLMENSDDKTYPTVYAKCSNEYTILDYNYDNNIKEYFSSWNYWHYAIAGPNNGDTVNWEGWYLANDEDTKFLVSPDCTTCDETASNQYYETKTAYWMTGNMFGCWWDVKGFPVCDLDWDTYTCYYCDDYTSGDSNPIAITEDSPADYYKQTGQCVTSIQSSSMEVPLTHENCTSKTLGEVMKPSLGISGKFCVCAQPSEQKSYDVDTELLSKYKQKFASKNVKEKLTSSNNIVYLYQKDFLYGTYRITEAGTYTIMEDIEFEFNEGDYDDPFAEGSWWPSSSQSTEYPGAGSYRDPYFLGFFAGITVETSDVVIDLNDHTLKMSEFFYYYQRWFSIIELESQYFLPGQGPGFMGYDPKYGSDIVIKNGILGLTSHFGIHGNFNDNVQVLNVKIQDFETHGIQFNGWTNLVLSNVDIGPSSTQAYIKAEFGHALVVLPRLKKIYEENPDGTIHFANRDEMTMNDIAIELEAQMKMAIDWARTKTEPTIEDTETQERWEKAKALFINEDGIPYSSSLTGLFLNLHSTSVFTFNLNTDDYSSHATIENVKIHDLYHSFQEWIRFSENKEIYVNSLTGPMDVLAMVGEDELDYYKYDLDNDFSEATYKGNALTDAFIAMNKLSDNWGYLGAMLVKNSVTVAWAENESEFYDGWGFGCNVDPMLHSGKGILGFRMDGVQDVQINGLEIYNLYDMTPLGREECGAYSNGFVSKENRELGGHFRQLAPIQVGFSGNMVLGVSIVSSRDMSLHNVKVHDLESETGLIDGIAVWTHCTNISFQDALELYNFNAGSQVKNGTLSYSDRPNKAPEACGLKIQWETSTNNVVNEDYDTTDIFYNGITSLKHCNMKGHVGCDGATVYSTEKSINLRYSSECSSTSDGSDDESSARGYRGKVTVIDNKTQPNPYFNVITIVSSVIIIASIAVLIFLLKKCCANQDTSDHKYSLLHDYSNVSYGSTENNGPVVL